MRPFRPFVVSARAWVGAGAVALAFSAAAQVPDVYTWGRFDTGGGGYFTGLAFSPSTPGLMYARSDVVAPHKLAPGATAWTFTGGTFWPEKAPGRTGTPYAFGGSTGLAVHPTDPAIVFASLGNATGNYDGTLGLYRSSDGGTNWSQVLSVYVFANSSAEYGSQRKLGNPVEIDRQNPAVVYFGTQRNGLYRSLASGNSGTFTRIASIPNGADVGTKSVVVDRFSPLVAGRSSVVYASVYNDGVYRSTDGGDTFTKLPGSPRCPQWMVLGPDARLYVTNEGNAALDSVGGIFRFDGAAWSDLTPAGYANSTFLGLDVNPFDARQLVAVANGSQLFRSADGGASWTAVSAAAMSQLGDLTFTSQGGRVRALQQAASAVHFDPHVNGVVYVCDAFMVWKSTNAFGGGTIQWTPLYQGLNNSIPFAMIAPPQAPSGTVALLYAGGADTSQYRYDTLGGKPAAFIGSLNGYQQYFNGLDFCEDQPDHIWAVGKASGSASTKVARVTTGAINSGTTWTRVSTPFGTTQTHGTRVAVSASNSFNAVVVPGNNQPNKYTRDGGLTWANCVGLPAGAMPVASVYDTNHPIESDKRNGGKFYLYHHRNGGEFYRSEDGGANWTLVNTDIPAHARGEGGPYPIRVAVNPAAEGDVWVALGENGLHRSTDSGATFSAVPFFSKVSQVDFGANAAGNPNATAYVHGRDASGQWGIFRSTNNGASWFLITPPDRPFAKPIVMEADRKTYGRIFLSDYGSGIAYGEIGNLVAAPTFSPRGGISATAQTVTLATPTADATIRYTTDGSEPTAATGTVYAGPIHVSSSTTLRARAFRAGFNDSAVSSETYTIDPNAPQTPFGGFARSIPGFVQFEDYDAGGRTIAFADTTPGNTGSAYRANLGDDVDIESTTDSGGGHNVGWTDAGEWMEYTVDVAPTGLYALDLRTASGFSGGGSVRFEVDGEDRTGPIPIPDTGGWQTFRTIRKNDVPLAAGRRILRVTIVQPGVNLNWFRFQLSATATLAPTMTPPAGTYATAQAVTLSTPTAGATIRYTTDGSAPTAATGTAYAGPISVANTTTLRAIAFRPGLADSPVTTATYLIAINQPPQASHDLAVVNEGGTVAVDVLANDQDADSGPSGLSLQNVGAATHGTTQIASGRARYTPNAGFVGTDSFDYTITDGAATASAVVTVTVQSTALAGTLAGTTAGFAGTNVGSGSAGSSRVLAGGNWEITGSGSGLAATADSFRFESRAITGDFEVLARVNGVTGSGAQPLAGIMVRESSAAGARSVALATSTGPTGPRYHAVARRTTDGSSTVEPLAADCLYPNAWIGIVRTGDRLERFTSADGQTWASHGVITLDALDATLLVGLFSSSGTPGASTRAVISNYEIVQASFSRAIRAGGRPRFTGAPPFFHPGLPLFPSPTFSPPSS